MEKSHPRRLRHPSRLKPQHSPRRPHMIRPQHYLADKIKRQPVGPNPNPSETLIIRKRKS
jgi:hypothetical protein